MIFRSNTLRKMVAFNQHDEWMRKQNPGKELTYGSPAGVFYSGCYDGGAK